jgi:hypothetical protein
VIDDVLDGFVAELVGGAVDVAALESAASDHMLKPYVL